MSDESTYITGEELRQLASIIAVLERVKSDEISVSVSVYDRNGESLGYIYKSSGGSYALHRENYGG